MPVYLYLVFTLALRKIHCIIGGFDYHIGGHIFAPLTYPHAQGRMTSVFIGLSLIADAVLDIARNPVQRA